MNWLDILILIVVAISTLVGLKAGIIKGVLSLAGLIAGVVLAGRYYPALAERLTLISQPNLAAIAAFAIILIGVMLITAVLAWVITMAVSAVMLGWANHLGGVIFGFGIGALFCGAVLSVWLNFLGPSGFISDSALAGILLDTFPMVLALLPEEFGSIRSFFQ